MRDEVRRSHTDDVTIKDTRVKFEYKKGMKTYYHVCPGGVARTTGSFKICSKSSHIYHIARE